MDEIVAELQREKEKNAELLERIQALEAQIQHNKREKCMNDTNFQGIYRTEERIRKKYKRHKDNDNRLSVIPKDSKLGDALVSWMSIDDTKFRVLDKQKEGESVVKCDEETDDSEDEDEHYCIDDQQDTGNYMNVEDFCTAVDQDNKNGTDVHSVSQIVESANIRNFSLQKKPPKVAFCPKEAKRILNSTALSAKNAQSHTMRKIIVFASLGIRHGCDDMYELDYNHFSILRKGEPYMSQNDAGEHVLYDNPGVKQKVFYPNRDNPALCPVQILEEEQAMSPSGTSCPSCLFLCIKYGGQTRNIPQNEYVRQRMGRNKLKSFGPLICHMAGLVNVRTGSFFFKALAITLLFMAGFSDDIVQRETKYKSLDLLQKYYRTDEDASGQELFVTHLSPTNLVIIPDSEKSNGRTTTNSKGKRKINSSDANSQRPPQATAATQFGLLGYTPAPIPQAAGHQTLPLMSQVANCEIRHPQPNISYYNHQPLYPMFQPRYPPNAMMPLMYWPSPQPVFPPPWPYPSPHGFRPVGAMNGAQSMTVQPHFNYNQGLETSSSVLAPISAEAGTTKNTSDHPDGVAVSDSESSAGSTNPKK